MRAHIRSGIISTSGPTVASVRAVSTSGGRSRQTVSAVKRRTPTKPESVVMWTEIFQRVLMRTISAVLIGKSDAKAAIIGSAGPSTVRHRRTPPTAYDTIPKRNGPSRAERSRTSRLSAFPIRTIPTT